VITLEKGKIVKDEKDGRPASVKTTASQGGHK
jgi:hypothetical protein